MAYRIHSILFSRKQSIMSKNKKNENAEFSPTHMKFYSNEEYIDKL